MDQIPPDDDVYPKDDNNERICQDYKEGICKMEEVIMDDIKLPITRLLSRRCPLVKVEQLVSTNEAPVRSTVHPLDTKRHGFGSKKDGILMAVYALSHFKNSQGVSLAAIVDWLKEHAPDLNVERNSTLHQAIKRLISQHRLMNVASKDRQLTVRLDPTCDMQALPKLRDLTEIVTQHSNCGMEQGDVYEKLAHGLGWNWGWNQYRLDSAVEAIHEMDNKWIENANIFWGIPTCAMEWFVIQQQVYLREWLKAKDWVCPEPHVTNDMLLHQTHPPSPLVQMLKLKHHPDTKEWEHLSWIFQKYPVEHMSNQLDQLNQVLQWNGEDLDTGIVRDILWGTDSFQCIPSDSMKDGPQSLSRETAFDALRPSPSPTFEAWERAVKLKESMQTSDDHVRPPFGYTCFQESLEKPGVVCELVKEFVTVHHLTPLKLGRDGEKPLSDQMELPSFKALFE